MDEIGLYGRNFRYTVFPGDCCAQVRLCESKFFLALILFAETLLYPIRLDRSLTMVTLAMHKLNNRVGKNSVSI